MTDLPPDLRRAFARELQRNRPELSALAARLAESRAALIAATTAEPFDAARAEAAALRVRQATEALQKAAQRILIETAERERRAAPVSAE